ncbi:hypothetical protein [Micromonospora echinofusca]|uniref:LemA protein n=1 Tax=Micromonospora echinofusca TaxID=47858 RepID=A0ABS3VUI7_MICEH|nr:hypothetical protein [Micromonospora echinofusca]MBO4208202.1 hypothetical protein [Micromonospora echinofusca]
MQWLAPIMGFLGGVVAASVTAIITVRTNRSKMAADIRSRWDAALLEKANDLTEATRSLRHLAEGYPQCVDRDAQTARLDEVHQRLRITSEQLRLVGDIRVQAAARRILQHGYAVRTQAETGEDPRAAQYQTHPPVSRLNDALQEFYRAVRHQLRAPDADDVLHDDDLDAIALSAGNP